MINQRLTGMIGKDGRAVAQMQPMPPLSPGCVLVKVHASLISPGTELSNARAVRQQPTPANMEPPRPFGYQNAGEVLQVGQGVTRFKPGDRVACLGAKQALHANYVVVGQNLCGHLPENVSYEQGAFMNLALTALNALRRGETALGEYALCVGLGLVGQMAGRLAQLSGAQVMGWDMLANRCDMAGSWAVDAAINPAMEDVQAACKDFTHGNGFDLVFMTVPGDATKAVEAVRHVVKKSPDHTMMARLCMIGGQTTLPWGAGMGNMDLRSCSRSGPGYHDPKWETGDEAVRLHVEQPDTTIGTIITMTH